MLCLKVIDKKGKTAGLSRGERETNLPLTREYQEGDQIFLEAAPTPCYVWLQVDEALGYSMIYLTGDVHYRIPFGEKRINLPPKAFSGEKHLIRARLAKDFEIKTYRNLALNVNDQHENDTSFPHASANVETRGESVFAASNAIDGITANSCHGEWPYQSWGINRNPEAKWKLDFGRQVETDRLVIYLRADFPHDNWWEKITVTFSDGEKMECSMKKTGEAQEFTFDKKRIRWLELSDLIPSREPSPFPALSQIEVYGNDL